MKWIAYNLLFFLAYPFLLPGFLLRMCRRGGYAARINDRFAFYPKDFFGEEFLNSRPVWIHAVSVGEVQVAMQLIRQWRKVDGNVRFCFSTTSSTGWKVAERELDPQDRLIYNPLDFPNFVKSALKTVRPRAVILTESEIWPNFILTAHKLSIPLFLINARVSDRSAPRYRMGRFFFKDVFKCFMKIYAQSDLDASRLRAAMEKTDADKVSVVGSFKFDVACRNSEKERQMREWVGDGRVLLGGSTWPGEDEVLLRIYSRLRGKVKLVIAPRHFEKADSIEENIERYGFTCRRRSRGDEDGEVLLADTTGELMGLYGIADVVFVGKSLCAHGSQNMIEPCLCGKVVFVGPYTENFRPVMSDLLASNAIVQVPDAAALEAQIISAFGDDPEGTFKSLALRAEQAVLNRRGVVPKCVDDIRWSLR